MEKEGIFMFEKDLFVNDGAYLRYRTAEAPYGQIVGRWKYTGGFVTKGVFKKWLMKSGIEVAEYFDMIKNGIAPVDVMRKLDESYYNSLREKWKQKQIEKWS